MPPELIRKLLLSTLAGVMIAFLFGFVWQWQWYYVLPISVCIGILIGIQ